MEDIQCITCQKCKEKEVTDNFFDTIFKLHCDECFARCKEESRVSWIAETELIITCRICSDASAKGEPQVVHKCIRAGVYCCCICGQHLDSKKDVIEHFKTAHTVTNVVSEPDELEVSESSKEDHVQKGRRHKCSICDKAFPTPSKLKLHVQTHSGEKSFTCVMCGKGYIQMANLKSHILSIHTDKSQRPPPRKRKVQIREKIHKCSACNKAFAIPSKLKAHLQTHTGEKPYTCTICDKSYAQMVNLKSHMLYIHSEKKDDRPQCNVCLKTFYDKSNLYAHMFIHSGEKRYHCKICNKSYTHRFSLKKHNKMIHKI